MADFTQSVTNSLEFTGLGPSSKWDSMLWTTDKWDEGSQDFVQDVGKYITNSLTSDTTISNSINKIIENSLTPTGDLSSETLTDGSGYNYIFPLPTTEGESRSSSTFSESTAASTSFTTGTNPSTSWT